MRERSKHTLLRAYGRSVGKYPCPALARCRPIQISILSRDLPLLNPVGGVAPSILRAIGSVYGERLVQIWVVGIWVNRGTADERDIKRVSRAERVVVFQTGRKQDAGGRGYEHTSNSAY